MTVGMVRGDRATSGEGGTSREVRFVSSAAVAVFPVHLAYRAILPVPWCDP